MKSKLSQIVATVLLAGATTLGAQAQEVKIGYVNSERILRETNLAKAAETKLQAEFSRREKALLDLETKLRGAAEKLDKDSPALSEAERGRRQRELIEQDRDLQRKRREFNEDVAQRKNEELSAVIEKANKVIKKIFEDDKYDLIVQDAIHASPRVDITKKVIDQLNAQK
ncbi:OmpH family outer membrane protein [Mitsuaria sp. TWR114]|jgi:outer membrane protein|uniref:OmpH family outer membrane protein n=1 Tax=unclassified Roseateles TaxID=2626991 RepID=UPI0008EB1037|nr:MULTISPECIES: OmpH family outer membrane protein [unclassified Roseateles]MBB3280335.1 outer membrane protein [Mitsuaria sp. BK037]MBB3292383.1 outer membrane protein [Mitsuaria sp. BK041]MBB3361600.1 outer membrane protein [Mitsuaria sp. BK045]TXD81012.1 OmpH family outer membrane protein [Mitsuaria sp. TWR114]SFR74759.1 periplasmic chaperone for outer membrane proteins Skp [Mitsuaria sp. PDC51]